MSERVVEDIFVALLAEIVFAVVPAPRIGDEAFSVYMQNKLPDIAVDMMPVGESCFRGKNDQLTRRCSSRVLDHAAVRQIVIPVWQWGRRAGGPPCGLPEDNRQLGNWRAVKIKLS